MKFEIVRIDFKVILSVCCHPKILIPWQRDVRTSPLVALLKKPSLSLRAKRPRFRTLLLEGFSWYLIEMCILTNTRNWNSVCFFLIHRTFNCYCLRISVNDIRKRLGTLNGEVACTLSLVCIRSSLLHY